MAHRNMADAGGDDKQAVVRLLTLGDSGAGKSSLLLRYTANEYSFEYMPTIGYVQLKLNPFTSIDCDRIDRSRLTAGD